MGFKTFSVKLVMLSALMMLNLITLAYLLSVPGYHAASLLLAILLIIQIALLYRFIGKTNLELVRFFDAARYADFTQRFELQQVGAGFGELGTVFSDILHRFQAARAHQEEELRHLKAVVDHVPVPLLSLHQDGNISLWNNSARRLFGAHTVNHQSELNQFGQDFCHQVQDISPGERRLTTFAVDGTEQQLSLSATQLVLAGKMEKLISMQDIQGELDAAQLKAWQDLVRVLTHEIMNSITPVASLARTASVLVDDAKSKVMDHPDAVAELDDVAHAIDTLSRRSESLTGFVNSYRRLTRLPAPTKGTLSLQQLFQRVAAVSRSTWSENNVQLDLVVKPETLEINADSDMIEQVLINLLQNAQHASEQAERPHIRMSAWLNKRGHVVVDVEDNGPGIATEVADKVFVPFFTTKRDGSGVGLALSRQVMIAHGGNIKLGTSELGGALLRLTF